MEGGDQSMVGMQRLLVVLPQHLGPPSPLFTFLPTFGPFSLHSLDLYQSGLLNCALSITIPSWNGFHDEPNLLVGTRPFFS